MWVNVVAATSPEVIVMLEQVTSPAGVIVTVGEPVGPAEKAVEPLEMIVELPDAVAVRDVPVIVNPANVPSVTERVPTSVHFPVPALKYRYSPAGLPNLALPAGSMNAPAPVRIAEAEPTESVPRKYPFFV